MNCFMGFQEKIEEACKQEVCRRNKKLVAKLTKDDALKAFRDIEEFMIECTTVVLCNAETRDVLERMKIHREFPLLKFVVDNCIEDFTVYVVKDDRLKRTILENLERQGE